MLVSVTTITDTGIVFSNGWELSWEHSQDCCESHWLDFSTLTPYDFDQLWFDLTTDKFFTRIPGYGIALNPDYGHPIRIPGYGSNNGYYNSNITLILTDEAGKPIHEFDITECQDY